jgi:hypothetical protein
MERLAWFVPLLALLKCGSPKFYLRFFFYTFGQRISEKVYMTAQACPNFGNRPNDSLGTNQQMNAFLDVNVTKIFKDSLGTNQHIMDSLLLFMFLTNLWI